MGGCSKSARASSAERKAEEERIRLRPQRTHLYFDIKDTQWPIIYTPEYNITFMGLEKLHPFDSGKWGRVFEFLREGKMVREDTIVNPREAQTDDLLVVHPKKYLDSLKITDFVEGIQEWSINVAGITEVPPVAMLPNFLVQRKVLKPFRYHTGGTILAAKLALERGWSINIGGGFHHCSASHGGGFCAYADITLSIKFLFSRYEDIIKKVLIIDLDAHQGNGYERDFAEDDRVYILDMYNRGVYPHDGFAKRSIKRKVELQFYTEDEEYLQLVQRHVEGALNEFEPDFIMYNAGTDVLDGDPLGCLSISDKGIVARDEIVFEKARSRCIPIVMVTSGGYQKSTARIIADSILNLRALQLISCDAAEDAPPPADAKNTAAMTRSSSEGGLWSRLRRGSSSSLVRSQTHIEMTAEDLEEIQMAREAQKNIQMTSDPELSQNTSSDDEVLDEHHQQNVNNTENS